MERQKLTRVLAWLDQQMLSQADFARVIDLDPNYVSMILNGWRQPTFGFKSRWAKAINPRTGQPFGLDFVEEMVGRNGHPA